MADTQAGTILDNDPDDLIKCFYCSTMGDDDQIKGMWWDVDGNDISFYTAGPNPTLIKICEECFWQGEEEDAINKVKEQIKRHRFE